MHHLYPLLFATVANLVILTSGLRAIIKTTRQHRQELTALAAQIKGTCEDAVRGTSNTSIIASQEIKKLTNEALDAAHKSAASALLSSQVAEQHTVVSQQHAEISKKHATDSEQFAQGLEDAVRLASDSAQKAKLHEIRAIDAESWIESHTRQAKALIDKATELHERIS